jgi:sigma-54 dependent transcriptional regulator, acetoin dehydrogenase operon transcriptional activator AcoR
MLDTRTRSHGGDDAPACDAPATPFLVVALDCAQPLRRPRRLRLDGLAEVRIGRGAAPSLRRDAGSSVDLRLPDAWMSTQHVQLRHTGSTWLLEDPGSKNGTLVNGVPCRRAILADGDVVTAGGTLLLYRTHAAPAGAGDLDLQARRPPAGLATLVPALEDTLAVAVRVARSRVPMLLLGDTGSGKEVLARAIHATSGLAGDLVPVNCGSLPPTLIEAELFGARKGAYSGATEDRPGLIRGSDGGTLFLDEIAELAAPVQASLLRVLQDGEVRPLGHHRAVPVSLRLVTATHRDLDAMIQAGEFRRDLYARLAGHRVLLPPLRDRRDDIGLLVAELLERLAGERAARIRLSPAAGSAILCHDWPLNVRELEQCLAAALAIADGDQIDIGHLPAEVRGAGRSAALVARGAARATTGDDTPDEGDERARIVAALDACAGNQIRAARILGMSRTTFIARLTQHRIPRPRGGSR